MASKFITTPPQFLGRGTDNSAAKQIRRMVLSILRIVGQTFVPFNPRPEEPDSLPQAAVQPDDQQVEQCQWIFDQAEARRDHLEQKAQWTFALILFLTPLVASIFVFLVREGAPDAWGRSVAIGLLLASTALLFLGFISIVRAVSVQARESLFLGAVIDLATGQFRKYDKAFHAGGLLYCASVNTAMNDHIAQFVKGAHIFTTAAVVALVAAAVPASVDFSKAPTGPVATKIVGSVTISSAELTAFSNDVASLRKTISEKERSQRIEQRLRQLEAGVAEMERSLNALTQPTNRRRSGNKIVRTTPRTK